MHAGGRSIVVLDDETAGLLGVYSSDRVSVTYGNKQAIGIVNIAENFPCGSMGLYEEISEKLGIRSGDTVQVEPAEKPEGLCYVQAKIRGERLRENEIRMIVEDVVERHLSDIEIASFVTALSIHGISMDEVEALSKAMVESGSTLALDKWPILDKHSIGGIPGDNDFGSAHYCCRWVCHTQNLVESSNFSGGNC
jgi:AMP phosphorylase